MISRDIILTSVTSSGMQLKNSYGTESYDSMSLRPKEDAMANESQAAEVRARPLEEAEMKKGAR